MEPRLELVPPPADCKLVLLQRTFRQFREDVKFLVKLKGQFIYKRLFTDINLAMNEANEFFRSVSINT